MHEIVDAGLQLPEPPRLDHRPGGRFRHGVGLNEALDLLLEHRVVLEAVELDRAVPGSERRRRGRGVEGEHVDVRVPLERRRVEQEEELSPHVVRVVEDEGVFLDEAPLVADAGELEDPRVQIAALLRPHGLEVHGAELALRLEAEVPRREPLGQEAGAREPEGHVAHVEASEDVVFCPLVADVDAVRGVELTRLVEVDVDPHALGDRTVELDAEEELGAQLRHERRGAAGLELHVARFEARPVAARAPSGFAPAARGRRSP
jgi:hypothetical protein